MKAKLKRNNYFYAILTLPFYQQPIEFENW